MIQNACTSNISMLLRFALQVLLSVFLLFITSWRLSLVIIAVVPVLVAVTRVYGLFVRKFSKQYQDALAGSSEVAQEALSNVRTVHSFAADQVRLRYMAPLWGGRGCMLALVSDETCGADPNPSRVFFFDETG